VLLKCINSIFYFPDKNAGVPKEIATGNECFCQFQVRFFGKGFHFMDARSSWRIFVLNITVACIWIGWLNTDGEKCIKMVYKLQRLIANLQKLVLSNLQKLVLL
jgi:hypothetical protein